MTIVVGTTTCAPYMDVPDRWGSWMRNAEAIKRSYGDGVHYFAALELDARGLDPFEPFIERLNEIGGDYHTFSYDDGRTGVTTANRLAHITMGQNLVSSFCSNVPHVSHLLFLAADTCPPPDVLPKMLELDHPLCAPHISTYGLRGEPVARHPHHGKPYPAEWQVESPRFASAAAFFIGREVFKRIRWRVDLEAGMTDDPAYCFDARSLLGVPIFHRLDCKAVHWPECIGPIEDRLTDATVVR